MRTVLKQQQNQKRDTVGKEKYRAAGKMTTHVGPGSPHGISSAIDGTSLQ